MRQTFCVLVDGKQTANQLQFLLQNVDQMVVMSPSSVIDPLVSAGALTKMVMSLWGQEQTEDFLVHLKVGIYDREK